MHLLISLYTISIYIRRHHSQFSQCEDRKTGWCTKPHANFFAKNNNLAVGTFVHKHASYEYDSRKQCRRIRAILRNIERRVCGFVLPAELASCPHPRVNDKKAYGCQEDILNWSSGDMATVASHIRTDRWFIGQREFQDAAWHFRYDTIKYSQSWKGHSPDSWDPRVRNPAIWLLLSTFGTC